MAVGVGRRTRVLFFFRCTVRNRLKVETGTGMVCGDGTRAVAGEERRKRWKIEGKKEGWKEGKQAESMRISCSYLSSCISRNLELGITAETDCSEW